MFERPDHIESPLYVVTSVFNATRYRNRWKLYQDFVRMVEAAGAILYTVEVAFGRRLFAVTEPGGRVLQLRTNNELWIKENAINLLIQKLPPDWQYVATLDCDIGFARSDWANETVHQLQHYDILQMFSEAQDMNPDCESIQHHKSLIYCWMNGIFSTHPYDYYYGIGGHPGFAWAYRRTALDALGGLIDCAIAGAGDNHMGKAIIGRVNESIHPKMVGPYRSAVERWQERAKTYIKENVGYVPGKLLHYWHGPKVDRGYRTRWRILVDNEFNPITDLKKDWQGLWQLVVESKRQMKLRDDLRTYFRKRNEDALE